MSIIGSISGIIKAISAVSITHQISKLISEPVFHFNVFALLLITICLCVIAYIIARFFPKKVSVTPTQNSSLQVPMTNVPLDYQEYLKYKEYDKQYNSEERFSFSNMFSGFGKGINYAKAFVIGTIFLIMLFVGYGVYKEVKSIFVKVPPVASTITNTGGGKVDSKTESKSDTKQSNGLNLNIFSSWF